MEVKLHDIGEGMVEAVITTYLVQPGDYVKADDPLLEVHTDKMTAEIPSPQSGIVKEFLVKPGETVPVGASLLVLESAGKPLVAAGNFTEREQGAGMRAREPILPKQEPL